MVEVKGTIVTAVRNEKYLTRNVSQFKQIEPSVSTPEANDSDTDVSDGESEADSAPVPIVPVAPARRYPARQRCNSSLWTERL